MIYFTLLTRDPTKLNLEYLKKHRISKRNIAIIIGEIVVVITIFYIFYFDNNDFKRKLYSIITTLALNMLYLWLIYVFIWRSKIYNDIHIEENANIMVAKNIK